MAISPARRHRRDLPADQLAAEPELPAEPLPIGLPDVAITGCPVCSRPIAVGTARCPGCGTRLIIGVPARRASALVAVGLVVGVVLGSGVTAAFAARVAPPPGRALSASPANLAQAATSSAGGRPSAAVPGQASAALGQALVVNGRLAARGAELRGELVAPKLDTFAVATTLRGLAADAVVGRSVTGMIADWSPGSDVADRLSDYYALVASTATETLGASLSDTRGYRAGAGRMLRVLGQLGALDAATQTLAAQAGLTLPSASATGAATATP